MKSLFRKSLLSFSWVMLVFSAQTYAFKIDTHLWLADKLYAELTSGYVDFGPDIGAYPIPKQILDSLKLKGGREAFLIGVLGPDLYPDMIAGQMTTHPGLPLKLKPKNIAKSVKQLATLLGTRIDGGRGWQTDDWLEHVRNTALGRNRTRPSTEIAFAYGYLLHAAMDTWAHTYVNLYTGDLFSISVNRETAARHIAIESYIAKAHEKFRKSKKITKSWRAGKPIKLGSPVQTLLSGGQSDNLADLAAPSRFVRTTLILNRAAANQYAHADGGQQVWSMYALWDYAQRTRQNWTRLKPAFDNAASLANRRVFDADVIWRNLDVAKGLAVTAAEQALTAKEQAEAFALEQAHVLNNVISDVLSFLNNLPAINATIENFESFINLLPSILSEAYDDAKSAFEEADKARTEAIDNYDRLARASSRAGEKAVEALDDLELEVLAEAFFNNARDTGWAVINNNFLTWQSNIEAGVDAYSRAWEETAREIMRPPGNRFSKGSDVTGPLEVWAKCWGPVFGMSAFPVNPQLLSAGCENTLTGFGEAQEELQLFVLNQAFDLLGMSALKQTIVDFDDGLEELIRDSLPLAGEMIAATVGQRGAGARGAASFVAQLWEKEIDEEDLNIEFESDESEQNLPVYDDVAGMLVQDRLPQTIDNQDKADIGEMLKFNPVYNALMLSRLTFLDEYQLNTLARKALEDSESLYTDAGGRPVYANRVPAGKNRRIPAPAGAILIGAIRSIDGNHQWQPVAPELPRGFVGNSTNVLRATDDTCRRFGYPFQTNYGNDCGTESYVNSRKGGFRFWIDENLRERVFNRIFNGPLSRAICYRYRAANRKPGKGIGCGGDPYPASLDYAIESDSQTRRTLATRIQSPVAPRGQRTVPDTAVVRVRRITPAKPTIKPGAKMVLTLEGENLNKLSALSIQQRGRNVPGIRVTLEPATKATSTRRRATVQTSARTKPGNYQVTVFAGRKAVGIPRGTVVSIVSSKR